jgi:hypothetical protein
VKSALKRLRQQIDRLLYQPLQGRKLLQALSRATHEARDTIVPQASSLHPTWTSSMASYSTVFCQGSRSHDALECTSVLASEKKLTMNMAERGDYEARKSHLRTSSVDFIFARRRVMLIAFIALSIVVYLLARLSFHFQALESMRRVPDVVSSRLDGLELILGPMKDNQEDGLT